jgi:hypothetical protein
MIISTHKKVKIELSKTLNKSELITAYWPQKKSAIF